MTSAISIVLRPLAEFYDDPATIEVRMTRPKMVVVDRRGQGKAQIEAPTLTLAKIEDMCRSLANFSGVKFDPDSAPKLSCIIPKDRHRFECLVGSSAPFGVSMAIRCKHPFTPTWEQVGATPAIIEYLKTAMAKQLNIVISGATNTGKTTLANKLLGFLPADRRVVALEDTPELDMSRFWDGVALLAAREASTASGMIDWRQLYDHQMRITPDNVIFGEISTQNSFAALGSLNSGITGFMCTIHAESPQQALTRKFEQNIAWSGQNMPRVSEFLAELVDVVIQIKRDSDGWRRITDIYEPRNDLWVMRDSQFVEGLAA